LNDHSVKPPTKELFNLFFRLTNNHGSIEMFCDVLEGKELNEHGKRLVECFEIWKKYEAPQELEAVNYFYSLLTEKKFPNCIHLFMNDQKCSNKAKQIYELIDLWYENRRIFFMFVFKFAIYSRYNKRQVKPGPDLNFVVYRQASDALWDFIETLKDVNMIGKNNKKRFRSRKTYEEWISWAKLQGNRYIDFINFADKERCKVFCMFLSLYLKDGRKNINIVR
jgi:hypothetical protein